MLCGGSIGLQADTVTLVTERSIALQGNTVPQVRGNAPQIPCFTMPLEFPAPPSLQILAIARYRCGLRLVWHENPSLLYVPSRMKHYTRQSFRPRSNQVAPSSKQSVRAGMSFGSKIWLRVSTFREHLHCKSRDR